MSTLTAEAATELFRREPVRFVPTDAGEIAVRSVGNGPDVLFVHGWPLSGATWRGMLPHLVDHVRCHVVDLVSAGSSRFDADAPASVASHIVGVRAVVDALELADVAVVGHDSGGLVARHAFAGDPRLRAMGLVDTEHPEPGFRFRSFIAARRLPGLASALGFVARRPALARSRLVFGDAVADRRHLGGEFDEFFFGPLRDSEPHRRASAAVFRSFDMGLVAALPALHARIDVPVHLIWGEQDRFLPLGRARAMVHQFPRARLTALDGVGLLAQEEAPLRVAEALLPTLTMD